MHSIETIKENYKKFSDAKIEHIALSESKSLRKEVLAILKDEIIERGLDERMINWVDAETNEFEGQEREVMINKILNLPCPECGENKDQLYGFEFNRIISFIILIEHSQLVKILCMRCGKRAKFYAILTTFFAGWWSRSGILATPFIVIKDTLNFLSIPKISNRILNQLIDDNTGFFRKVGNKTNILAHVIEQMNKENEQDWMLIED